MQYLVTNKKYSIKYCSNVRKISVLILVLKRFRKGIGDSKKYGWDSSGL